MRPMLWPGLPDIIRMVIVEWVADALMIMG